MKRIIFISCNLMLAVFTVYAQQKDIPRINSENIVVYKDITYKVVDGYELKLDIAVPKCLNSPAPAIVDFPGGAWRMCNKSVEDAKNYASYGFIGVSAEYRTSDKAVFPAAVHDCKAVIRWLRAHAKEYNIDPDKIGVTGISAGGYLATLLGTSGGDEFLEDKGKYSEYSSSVQAVVDHFGPVDFLAGNDTAGLGLADLNKFPPSESPEALFLGGPVQEKKDLARLANPITYIDSSDPPVLIGHGEKDGMVIIRQSEMLFKALINAKIPTEFIRVKNADHQYRPYKWDVTISPSINELNKMTIQWFIKWLGAPDINYALARRKTESGIKSENLSKVNLYYKLTIDLPGETSESYCKGKFGLYWEGKTLASGDIYMENLSTTKSRTFFKEVTITGIDLHNKKILWNFRGEIYDSKLGEKFEPMYMQEEMYNDSITGIGFYIHIKTDKSFKIDKVVYRK
jgi:acetyl esterase/lipase